MNAFDFSLEHQAAKEALELDNSSYALFTHILLTGRLTDEQKIEFSRLQSMLSDDVQVNYYANTKFNVHDILDAYIIGSYIGYCKGLSSDSDE